MRTVELLCCDELAAAVRAAWDRLATAGLPSLARNTHPTNRPHLTLATAAAFADTTGERLGRLFAAALPIRVRLAGVAVLGGSRPLVWLVRPDPALLALQAAVWAELGPTAERQPAHAPERWIPHLSLALRFRDADAERARAVVGAVPPSGALVAARSYDGATRTVAPLDAPG